MSGTDRVDALDAVRDGSTGGPPDCEPLPLRNAGGGGRELGSVGAFREGRLGAGRLGVVGALGAGGGGGLAGEGLFGGGGGAELGGAGAPFRFGTEGGLPKAGGLAVLF